VTWVFQLGGRRCSGEPYSMGRVVMAGRWVGVEAVIPSVIRSAVVSGCVYEIAKCEKKNLIYFSDTSFGFKD